MAHTPWATVIRLTIILWMRIFVTHAADAQTGVGMAFTHQGRLTQSGMAANGDFDFEFRPFDAASGGVQQGAAIEPEAVSVTDGLCTVELDFGAEVFGGEPRWLDIGVRPSETREAMTALTPRQRITPTPYSLWAAKADKVDGMDANDLISEGGDVQGLVRSFTVAPDEAVAPGDAVSFMPGSAQIRKGYEREGFGDGVVFNDGLTQWITMSLLTPDKFVITYRDAANSNVGAAIVGEVAGAEVSFGNEKVFNDVLTGSIACAALSPTRFVVAYIDSAGAGGGKTIVGEVTGTDIVYGSEVDFDPTDSFFLAVTALSNDRFIVAFHDPSNSNFGTAIVGSVSGTNITFSPKAVFI